MDIKSILNKAIKQFPTAFDKENIADISIDEIRNFKDANNKVSENRLICVSFVKVRDMNNTKKRINAIYKKRYSAYIEIDKNNEIVAIR